MNSKRSCIPGADLCKFYARPVDAKKIQNKVEESESDSSDEFLFYEEKENIIKTPKYLSIGTQTDYRESEAQTDPWDPPFYINRTFKEPEVLCLKELTYGKGLPATQTEIDYIIECRKNNLLEVPSEKISSYDEFLKKKKLISNQVRNEWNYKISKHSEKQLDKLKQMESALAKELSKHSERKDKLLKNIWTQKNNKMVNFNSKLKKELVKEIKALELKAKTDVQMFEEKATKNPSKELYLGDKHRDSLNEEMSHLLSKYYNDPDGLGKVTDRLQRKKSEFYNEIPVSRPIYKDEREKLAEKAYKDMLDKKLAKMPPKLYREDYDDEEDDVASSVKGEVEFEVLEFSDEGIDLVTVFQQVLRGRAYQKQMIELIEKHKDALDLLFV